MLHEEKIRQEGSERVEIVNTKNIMLNETKLSSRQRVLNAINHQPVDRVPVDIGGTLTSGAHVSIIAGLRQALGLDAPGVPVKVTEPFQMLGEVAPDLQKALGLDVVKLPGPRNIFGFENTGWKPWKTFDGTNVLVPEKFNTQPQPNGDILMYPQGDHSVPASARMPKGGFYSDAIIRQEPIDDDQLNPQDNLEEFVPISDEDLRFYEKQSIDLYSHTDLAIAAGFPGTAFGDIALVPAPFLKNPKGIRDIEEWYISTISRQDYILEVFNQQAEIAVENIERVRQAVSNRVHVVFMDGADLATQNSLFCSPQTYRKLYKPFHKRLNDWVHLHTQWKTFKHCCGACEPLIGEFIEAGFDILNPVQCSATGMDPQILVEKYGKKIVFWGGGVDTQKTLPFGTPADVRMQVAERLRIFGQNPGFVFNTVHNIQCKTPVENVLAMFESLGRKFS